MKYLTLIPEVVGALAAAAQNGHKIHQAVFEGRFSQGDERYTWRCQACGDRVLAFQRRGARRVLTGGLALAERCSGKHTEIGWVRS